MKELPVDHKDILGQPIHVGAYVAISRANDMKICTVTKMTNKMIRVVPIKKTLYVDNGYLVYAQQTVILNGPDALAYILKNL